MSGLGWSGTSEGDDSTAGVWATGPAAASSSGLGVVEGGLAAGMTAAEMAVLRVGVAWLAVLAVLDAAIALLGDEASFGTALEGAALCGIALAATTHVELTARLLTPPARATVVAAAFAIFSALDPRFPHVAAALVFLAAVVCSWRWLAVIVVISFCGYAVGLVREGHSLAWMVHGAGRYDLINQLFDLAANAAGALLLGALLHAFLADAPGCLAATREGGPSLTPQLAAAVRRAAVAQLPPAEPAVLVERLTPTEQQVVALLADGRAPKQIALDRGVELATVRAHLAAAKRKTGARTLEHLVALFVEAGGAARA